MFQAISLVSCERVTVGRSSARDKERRIGHNAAPSASAALSRCVKGWIMCRIKGSRQGLALLSSTSGVNLEGMFETTRVHYQQFPDPFIHTFNCKKIYLRNKLFKFNNTKDYFLFIL